ncbi:hypothetical protein V757_00910 [Pelistega indica]|uniref:Uncharacterized protein n=1 Tax=Pelistega indica TaxID=1414851 RepID=V8GB67_9BURK|nr:hypothetical protein [Pelistega indica]ETD72977.1 hypothetical protein V757_00910 [Pelistega indica]
MSDHRPPQTQLVETVRDLIKTQQVTQAIKEKELDIELERIRSNEKIALESINAQKGDRNEQIQAISSLHLQRNVLIGLGIVSAVVIIICRSSDQI